jgi:gentisate 1,2-dioxygenase
MNEQVTDLKMLEAELAKDSLKGLWSREEAYWAEPKAFGVPKLWKGDRIREGLKRAATLVPTNFNGSRRVITLVHPSLSAGSSHTLGFGVQLVKAGEAVYSHRHTAAAIRFVLEASDGMYTITNGEKCVMERGDLVVQPNWGWHNHINESDRDAVWIDCLDTGLMALLRTMFQEPHPAEDVKLFNSPIDNTVRNPGGLAPPGRGSKKLVYKWKETFPALCEMLPEDKSPYDGRCLEYRNPITGGPTLSTFSCWIQLLEGGEKTMRHRHTANHLCHAFQGSGITEVEGQEIAWEEGDFFVIPNWSWHCHENRSATEPAIIFSTTDRPSLDALGLYREQTT